jgi:SAM-dependent methyltransferase
MKISVHEEQILENAEYWREKPLLRDIYRGFHRLIAAHLSRQPDGLIVELGSGIGNIREVIPECICTDLFPNPWIDRVENAYALSFEDNSVSDLILFDVFHHLQYPGAALQEFRRVLKPGGHVIIFDPWISLLGWLVYGLFHQEPVGWRQPIEWSPAPGWSPAAMTYYAAQGNATRIFRGDAFRQTLQGWKQTALVRRSAISYVASGGYSQRQLYPRAALPLMQLIDRLCDLFPSLFATRALVVLEKSSG